MSNAYTHKSFVSLIIVVVSAILFLPLIGSCDLFDWDEINFAECAREMLMSDNYAEVQLYYQPFWEKPPIFIWMQALSMKMFGVNEFAARFPNAICGILTLLILFRLGRSMHSPYFGIIWTLLYAATLLPHFYFKSGIIDPWFNLFILLAMLHLYRLTQASIDKQKYLQALLAALFTGMAVLTKGPAAVLIIGISMAVYLLRQKSLRSLFSRPFLLFYAAAIIFSGSWFLVEVLRGHQKIILDFINYQIRLFKTGDAGHEGPFFYHVLVLLLGCFPASIFFIKGLGKKYEGNDKAFRHLMLCVFWVVLILFSVVKTKIIHYSSLCYFPLTYVAAADFMVRRQQVLHPALKILYWFLAALVSIAFVLIPLIDQLKAPILKMGLLNDPDAANNLQANGGWMGVEWLIGLVFFLACLLLYKAYVAKNRRQLHQGLTALILFNTLAIAVIVPKIGIYTQQAAIDFYREKAKEDCYIETHAFKSYAQLFYGNRQMQHFTNADQKNYVKNQLDLMVSEGHSRSSSYSTAYTLWLENGNIDKTTYIVVKTAKKDQISPKVHFHHLYDKNGFSFFVRKVGSTVK